MGAFYMITLSSLKDLPKIKKPIALTIGIFDGVHRGHQHLLQELKKRGTSVVLTFSTHPSEILQPHHPCPMICTLAERLNLLEQYGTDLTLLLPFTSDLAKTPYDHFIKHLHETLPFDYLILGEKAVLGKNGEGDEMAIKNLAKKLNFEALYLPKFILEGEVVSSRKIRQLLENNHITQAARLLGRDLI